ncbi:hypothetical protein WMY93_006028 [Mugilogobius chulae]|uniref:Uncharacterized protein n=1 Tax=Mugilogobius chulae TaxID=88201 RepID=A0AAW0PII5_9GOBI
MPDFFSRISAGSQPHLSRTSAALCPLSLAGSQLHLMRLLQPRSSVRPSSVRHLQSASSAASQPICRILSLDLGPHLMPDLQPAHFSSPASQPISAILSRYLRRPSISISTLGSQPTSSVRISAAHALHLQPHLQAALSCRSRPHLSLGSQPTLRISSRILSQISARFSPLSARIRPAFSASSRRNLHARSFLSRDLTPDFSAASQPISAASSHLSRISAASQPHLSPPSLPAICPCISSPSSQPDLGPSLSPDPSSVSQAASSAASQPHHARHLRPSSHAISSRSSAGIFKPASLARASHPHSLAAPQPASSAAAMPDLQPLTLSRISAACLTRISTSRFLQPHLSRISCRISACIKPAASSASLSCRYQPRISAASQPHLSRICRILPASFSLDPQRTFSSGSLRISSRSAVDPAPPSLDVILLPHLSRILRISSGNLSRISAGFLAAFSAGFSAGSQPHPQPHLSRPFCRHLSGSPSAPLAASSPRISPDLSARHLSAVTAVHPSACIHPVNFSPHSSAASSRISPSQSVSILQPGFSTPICRYLSRDSSLVRASSALHLSPASADLPHRQPHLSRILPHLRAAISSRISVCHFFSPSSHPYPIARHICPRSSAASQPLSQLALFAGISAERSFSRHLSRSQAGSQPSSQHLRFSSADLKLHLSRALSAPAYIHARDLFQPHPQPHLKLASPPHFSRPSARYPQSVAISAAILSHSSPSLLFPLPLSRLASQNRILMQHQPHLMAEHSSSAQPGSHRISAASQPLISSRICSAISTRLLSQHQPSLLAAASAGSQPHAISLSSSRHLSRISPASFSHSHSLFRIHLAISFPVSLSSLSLSCLPIF